MSLLLWIRSVGFWFPKRDLGSDSARLPLRRAGEKQVHVTWAGPGRGGKRSLGGEAVWGPRGPQPGSELALGLLFLISPEGPWVQRPP